MVDVDVNLNVNVDGSGKQVGFFFCVYGNEVLSC